MYMPRDWRDVIFACKYQKSPPQIAQATERRRATFWPPHFVFSLCPPSPLVHFCLLGRVVSLQFSIAFHVFTAHSLVACISAILLSPRYRIFGRLISSSNNPRFRAASSPQTASRPTKINLVNTLSHGPFTHGENNHQPRSRRAYLSTRTIRFGSPGRRQSIEDHRSEKYRWESTPA